MQNAFSIHFSFQGRLSRLAFQRCLFFALTVGFFAAYVLAYVLFGTFKLPIHPLIWQPDPFHQLLYFLIPMACAAPLIIKRHHDCGKPPMKVALFAGLCVGTLLFGAGEAGSSLPVHATLESFVGRFVPYAPITLFGLWLLADCAFKEGTDGQNKYGNQPRQ